MFDVLLLSVWTDPVRVNPAYQFLRQEIDACASKLAPQRLEAFFSRHGGHIEVYSRMLPYDVLYPYCPGLLALAAQLEASGFRVKCVSLDLERIRLNAADGWLDAALKPLLESTRIAVGVSAVTPELPRALEVLSAVKRLAPSLHTMIGGTHVSFEDAEAAMHPAVDVVVRGEGESTAVELVQRWQRGEPIDDVEGTTLRRPGNRNLLVNGQSLIRNRNRPLLDLTKLPPPAYHLLDRETRSRLKITPTYSRGCPFACEYCVESTFWERRVRHKDPVKFVDEIQYLVEEMNFRFIHIADSTFGVQKSAVVALCDELEKRKLDCVFSVNARPDLFTYLGEPLIRRLVSLNFVEFFLGAETADDTLLDNLNSRKSHGELLEALTKLRDIGVPFVKLYLMVGVPGDTHETLRKTIDAVRLLLQQELIYYATAKFFVPAPGTPSFAALASADEARKDWGQYERYNYPPWFPHESLRPWELEAYLLLLQGVQLSEMHRRLGTTAPAMEATARDWSNQHYMSRKYM